MREELNEDIPYELACIFCGMRFSSARLARMHTRHYKKCFRDLRDSSEYLATAEDAVEETFIIVNKETGRIVSAPKVFEKI